MAVLNTIETIGRKMLRISPDKAFQDTTFRKIYRDLRNRFIVPDWITAPKAVQLDLSNYCNLWMHGKGCIHCNVKPSGGWGLPRGRMSDEIVKYVIEYWGKRGANTICPYLNGEPLLDADRLEWIHDLCEANGLTVVYDSNGTLYENRFPLVHRNVSQVRFTVSATSREVYEKVHGADLFKEAKATVNWFLKNRLDCQYPMLYFICNRFNIHEIFDYVEEWRGKAHLSLFPLHEVKNFQHKSEESKFQERDQWSEVAKKFTGEYPQQPNRPIDVGMDGVAKNRYMPFYKACQVCDCAGVSWNGLWLHCTDLSYKFNYGHVYEIDMQEQWIKRNLAKLTHPACKGCNVKHPNHDEILKKYLKGKTPLEVKACAS